MIHHSAFDRFSDLGYILLKRGEPDNLEVALSEEIDAYRDQLRIAAHATCRTQSLFQYTLGRSIRKLQETRHLVFGHVLSREAINNVTIATQAPMEPWRCLPTRDIPAS
jgi:hypothetical protein